MRRIPAEHPLMMAYPSKKGSYRHAEKGKTFIDHHSRAAGCGGGRRMARSDLAGAAGAAGLRDRAGRETGRPGNRFRYRCAQRLPAGECGCPGVGAVAVPEGFAGGFREKGTTPGGDRPVGQRERPSGRRGRPEEHCGPKAG
ncbi:hypothetical protein DESC_700156 [Desulfosarcina cetonica]|nr:hypothetical protein DESC_700156 [Desulfosarcina cetonica]